MYAKMNKKVNKTKVLRAMIIYRMSYGGLDQDKYDRLT
jgi:hypothetical protein